MTWNIFEDDDPPTQESEVDKEAIVPLEAELLKLVAGGDVGSGLIKIPK